MSLFEKSKVIARAEARLEGIVGLWANEAWQIIADLKTWAQTHNDEKFLNGLKNLDRHMSQAPATVYQANLGQIGI
jgi:hypothetical protein